MRPQIKLPLTRKVENMCAPKTTAKKSAKAPKTPPPRDFFTPDIITNALKWGHILPLNLETKLEKRRWLSNPKLNQEPLYAQRCKERDLN